MKKRSLLTRMLAGALAVLMLLPCLPLSLVSYATATTKEPPSALDGLKEDYYQGSVTVTDEYVDIDGKKGAGYGNPVYLHYYYDKNKEYTGGGYGSVGSVVILYVMNTVTTRYGTDSDETIVKSLLDRDFYVVVMDYIDDPIASPDLDWSVQAIRIRLLKQDGTSGAIATPDKPKDVNIGSDSTALNYVLPAGYNITYGIPYFAYDLHGAAGCLELIAEIWNNDFKSVKREMILYWLDEDGKHKKTDPIDETHPDWYVAADRKNETFKDYGVWFKTADGTGDSISNTDLQALIDAGDPTAADYAYTYVGNTHVDSVYDCVKPDGSFIDLVLRMDVIYPTGEQEAKATMICFSSSYNRAAAWTSATRPQLTGFLFAGYTGVVSDYGLVPMCRVDHYGYYCGNSQKYSVSGDNYTYSLSAYNGVESDTALLRTLRALGSAGIDYTGVTDERDLPLDHEYTLKDTKTLSFPIKSDAIGGYGNSKAGTVIRLGEAHPELIENGRHFPGHVGESRYELMLDPTYGQYTATDGSTVTYYTDPYYDTAEDGSRTAKDADKVRLPAELPYKEGDTYAYASGLNLVYSNCGGCQQNITEGHCPIFGSGTCKSGGDGQSYDGYYRQLMLYARSNDIPFYGLVSPNVGHDYGNGLDADWGIDTYYAFIRYANYWLQDGAPSCDIIDVDTAHDLGVRADEEIDRIYEFDADSAVRIGFIGSFDLSEIKDKIKVQNSVTGADVCGEWTSLYGGQQFKFVPYDLENNTYYTVTVPADLTAKNGKSLGAEKTLTFRTETGTSVTADEASGNTSLGVEYAYFVFTEQDYASSAITTLRFTVTGDAANTVEVYAAEMGSAASYAEITAWTAVGEVALVGAGTYSIDVTEYTSNKSGALVFRLGQVKAAGNTVIREFDFDSCETGKFVNENYKPSSGNAQINAMKQLYATIEETAGAPYNNTGKAMKLTGMIRRNSWANLEQELSGNYVDSASQHFTVKSAFKDTALDESDLGRAFRISFRVYDTVSRNIAVTVGEDRKTVDGTIYTDFETEYTTFQTEAGAWKTYTLEQWITDPAQFEIFDRSTISFLIENKTAIYVGDATGNQNVLVGLAEMTNGNNTKPSNYAGIPAVPAGAKVYNTVADANAGGYIHINEKHCAPLYIDDIKIEEVTEDVTLFGKAALSLRTSAAEQLPLVSAAVDSDGEVEDGKLVIGGGRASLEDGSRRVYLNYDLSLYDTSGRAEIVLNATGDGTTVSVYGLSSAVDWSTLSALSSPAIDPLTGAVSLSAVYGGAPIATFAANGSETVTIDITQYARDMKAGGVTDVTLLLLTEEAQTSTSLYKIACVGANANQTIFRAGGFEWDKSVVTAADAGILFAPYRATCVFRTGAIFLPEGTNYNSSVLNRQWTEADIGKRYTVTFTVERTDSLALESVTLTYGMLRAGWDTTEKTAAFYMKDADGNVCYDPVNYGFNFYTKEGAVEAGSVTLKKGEKKTLTYSFTVTREMLPKEVYRISTGASEGVYGISYFGFFVPNGTANYGSTEESERFNDASLRPAFTFTDTISATEHTGETTISTVLPTVTEVRTIDFESGKFQITMKDDGSVKNIEQDHYIPGGYNITSEKVLTMENDGEHGNVLRYSPYKYNAVLRMNHLFDTDTTSNVHEWTEDEIGKSYRITFDVKAGDTARTLEFGLLRRYTALAQGTNSWQGYYAKDDPDAVDLLNVFYEGNGLKAGKVTVPGDGEWHTYTYEFTVTEEIAKLKEIFKVSDDSSLGSFAISLFGFKINESYSGISSSTAIDSRPTVYLDNIKAEKISAPTTPVLGSATFEAGTEYYIKANENNVLTSIDQNYYIAGGYQISENKVLLPAEVDGSRVLRYAPYKGNGTWLRLNGLFDADLSKITQTSGFEWQDDEIGKTYRVTFRVKVKPGDGEQTLKFGLMNFADRFSLQTTEGRATISDDGNWHIVSYEFTVTEALQEANAAYFALHLVDAKGTQTDTTPDVRNSVYLDDFFAYEVNTSAATNLDEKNSATVITGKEIDKTALTVLGKGETRLENICRTYLSATMPSGDLIRLSLKLPISAANGETVKVYALFGKTLSSSLTFENAPAPSGTPIAVLTANGNETITLDLTDLAREHAGESVVFLLAIDGASETVALETPILTVEKPAMPDLSDFKVKSNLTLSSDLCYNIYVPAEEYVSGITLAGVSEDLTYLARTVKDGKVYYVLTKALAAKDAADSIALTVTVTTAEGEKSAVYALSIPAYAKQIVNGSYDEKTQTLMKDMLAYIDAAMTYFNTTSTEKHKTITDVIGTEYALPDDADVGLTNTLPENSTEAKETIASVALLLEDTPAFVFYLKEGKEDLADTFSFTSAEGAPLKVEKRREDGRTLLVVTTYAYGMNDTLTFTYAGGSGSYNLAKYHSGTTDENLAKLTVRLAKYANSAKAYKAEAENA